MSTTSKHAFTAGPWSYSWETESRDWAIVTNAAGSIIANVNTETGPDAQSAPATRKMPAEANARLIAEAGTVAHETGLTPRQLADAYTVLRGGSKTAVEAWKVERTDLLAALVGVTDLYCELANSGDAGFWDPEKVDEVIAARAAIAKATAGGAV